MSAVLTDLRSANSDADRKKKCCQHLTSFSNWLITRELSLSGTFKSKIPRSHIPDTSLSGNTIEFKTFLDHINNEKEVKRPVFKLKKLEKKRDAHPGISFIFVT